MDPNQMMSRSFPMWAPPPAAAPDDPSAAPPPQQPLLPFLPPPNAQLAPNRGWKRKNPNSGGGGGYQPPAIGDLQVQNRAKARRWFKNPNNGNSNRSSNNNNKYFFPRPKAAAPRNTTSFIIRAKRAGGIASLVSPCPVTPAVLPTPRLSPTREGLSDMAQAQWGVDGYGSMKGLIRLRSSPHHPAASDEDDDSSGSGSDVEEHVEVERRLDQDLSRFEMVYPGRGDDAAGYVFEEEDEYDQDAHVARLEEENLTLKERLFLIERELGDMRRRLGALEARFADNVGAGAGALDNVAVDNAPAPVENNHHKEMAQHLGSEENVDKSDCLAVSSENKSRENNAESAGTGAVPEKNSEENNMDADGAVAEKKNEENNMEVDDTVPEKKSKENNMEADSAVPEKKSEVNNMEADSAVPEKKSEENNMKADSAVPEKKSEENNMEADSAVPEKKSGDDNVEESRLDALAMD